jgi:peptidoglycan/LPS O-acetylase OafA/YrhL
MRNSALPNYRSDLDGLRGLAVLAVITFHASQSLLPGGYLAVDAFFVVSGFLIFGQLWREYTSFGQIDFVDFWLRRLRRIVPTAALVVLAVVIFVFVFGKTSQFIKVGTDATYALSYLTNYYEIALNGDYFRIGDDLSLFQHFWFVAVEMQIYLGLSVAFLLLPMVVRLLGAKQLTSTVALVILLGTAVLSFVIYGANLEQSQSLGYYSTGGRLWQFLAGGIAYLCSSRMLPPTNRKSYLTVLALGLIFIPMFIAGRAAAQNQWTAVWPTLGATLFVLGGTTGPLGRVLAAQALKVVGHMSYSLYLWHWPCQQLVGTFFDSGVLGSAWALVMTTALSFLSYRYVEVPMRRSVRWPDRQSMTFAVMIAMVLSVSGVTNLLKFNGREAERTAILPGGKPINLLDFRKQLPEVYGGSEPCHLDSADVQLAPCVYGDTGGKRTIYLFGDSHAAQWFPALEPVARQRGYRLISHTKSSCPPISLDMMDSRTGRRNTVCALWRDNVLEDIKAISPDLLIVSSSSDYSTQLNGLNLNSASDLTAKVNAVSQLLMTMTKLKIPVLMIEDHAVLNRDPIACVLDGVTAAVCSVKREAAKANLFPWQSAKDLAGKGVQLVSFNDVLCNDGTCPAFDEDNLRYRDRSHLAAPYILTLRAEVAKFLPP